MIRAFHHRRPFDPSGDVYANSVTRTMKGQSLSTWDMFTRETLQNSWDARDRSSHLDGVSFGLDRVVLNTQQKDLLRHSVLGDDFSGLPELETLFEEEVDLLLVSDSGTRGLGGPSNPSDAYNGRDDFASFVRNIGRSDTKELAGGTYGFGKGVFFIVSRVNTALVYTRSHDENGQRVNRFISMANADDFIENGTKYTGRHWWGVYKRGKTANNVTEYAEPFVGDEADALAAALGMDRYFTEERPTGTCVAVVAPDMTNDESGEQDHHHIMTRIARSLTRWAWPHMLGIHEDMDPINFSVTDAGEAITIPDPIEDPALRHFAQAYRHALENPQAPPNKWESNPIARSADLWTGKPKKKRLGLLSVRNLHEPIREDDTVIEQEIETHIATIRNPRMIVEYYRGPVNTSATPYCGVFLADDEADHIFARSEPAAHHQWNHQTVQHDIEVLEQFWGRKSRNNPVKIFFDKMRALLKESGRGQTSVGDVRHFQSLTQLSSSLGNLISGATGGKDARVKPLKPQKNSSRPTTGNKPHVRTELAGYRIDQEGKNIAQFEVEITALEKQLPLQVHPSPFIAMDSGHLTRETASELGLDFPEVISVRLHNDDVNHETPNIFSMKDVAFVTMTTSPFKAIIEVTQIPQSAVGLKFSFQQQSSDVSTVTNERVRDA